MANVRVPRLTSEPITREWIDRAACRGAGPKTWFPHPSQPAAEAKRICAGCPVRGECLDYALENREEGGIWGGLNKHERKKVAAARRRAA
jgi:WhiB family redox-sensing transcriptional regulator